MRIVTMALAAAALVACDGTAGDSPKADAKPLLVAFEGAGATDPAAVRAHGERMATMLGCTGCTATISRARTSLKATPSSAI